MAVRTQPTLPKTSSLGFYEVRFESIGGLGAHLAGQILAETGVLDLGLNGAHFSSYGSEKKGSPVKSFVRFCAPSVEVRTSSPVEQPHLIAVFHEALMQTQDVAAGLDPEGTIIVNSARPVDEIAEHLRLPAGAVGVIDALRIAVEEKTRVNTAMLGAIARACGFIDTEMLKAAIARTFEKRYPQLVAANLRTFDRGYHELEFDCVANRPYLPRPRAERLVPDFGYRNAPIGGVILNPGNTALKDLSASRQGYLPEFRREKCTDCGLCDMVCPDLCFVWEQNVDKKGRPAQVLRGIDYRYCKGCLKCVEACPTSALVDMREAEGYAAQHRVAHFPKLG